MVDVAQLVRALVCGTRGREFDSPRSPQKVILYLKQKTHGVCSTTVSAAVCDIANAGSIPVIHPK